MMTEIENLLARYGRALVHIEDRLIAAHFLNSREMRLKNAARHLYCQDLIRDLLEIWEPEELWGEQ